MSNAENKEINTILLVDDDTINNFINHQLLKKLDLSGRIQCITSGKEALQFVSNFAAENDGNSPDLILLDINMPGMNGFEFLESFNQINFKNRNDIKVIFLTTSSHKRDLEKIRNDFKLSLINKPLTEEKLLDCLREIFNLPLNKSAGHS